MELKYCTTCLMPNTRPHIHFHEDGECAPCKNYKKQATTNWDARKKELELLCDKYRGKNGNGYDCAIAVSGGKDSHFQVWYIKEIMGMNPVLLSVGNLDWTETGRQNLQNLSETFSCDIIIHQPNFNISRKLSVAAFEHLGSPTWYWDALGYAYPWKMAIKLGLKFLIYGENVSYTYGGTDAQETPSAHQQSQNNVVKPEYARMQALSGVTDKEMDSAYMVSPADALAAGMEAIYLSYYTGWDSHLNYQVARRWGFKTLEHEHRREGTLEHYNQIDTLGYLLNQWMKYPKYGHASATEYACRWIRAGLKTRNEMIPLVKEKDKILDQQIAQNFMDFTGLKPREFFGIIDKWYNKDLFYQDKWGLWHEKFEVGIGLKK